MSSCVLGKGGKNIRKHVWKKIQEKRTLNQAEYSNHVTNNVKILPFQFVTARMSSDEDVPFTKKMRAVTREIHNVSDSLINAKLGIGKVLWT